MEFLNTVHRTVSAEIGDIETKVYCKCKNMGKSVNLMDWYKHCIMANHMPLWQCPHCGVIEQQENPGVPNRMHVQA